MKRLPKVSVKSAIMWGILGISVAFAVGIYKIVASQRSLLEVSTLVTSVEKQGNDINKNYYWLNSRNVMFFRGLSTNEFFVYNITTEKESRMTHLNEVIDKSDVLPTDWELSSNGQFLLWRTAGDIYCCKIDGTECHQWSQDHPCQVAWQHDNIHWLEFVWNNTHTGYERICVHNVETPLKSQILTVGNQVTYLPMPSCMTDDNNAVTATIDASHNYIVITKTVISQPVHKSNEYNLHPPTEGYIQDVKISHSGSKLCFLLTSKYTDLQDTLTDMLKQKYTIRKRFGTSLWCCGIDGKDMHCLGYIGARDEEIGNSSIENVKWLPDDEHISYIHKDKIWVTN